MTAKVHNISVLHKSNEQRDTMRTICAGMPDPRTRGRTFNGGHPIHDACKKGSSDLMVEVGIAFHVHKSDLMVESG